MSTGLTRFVKSARDTAKAAREPEVPRCELCSLPIGDEHGHVVDLENRGLKCTCRPCYILFTPEGSGGQRFRAVPDRYQYMPRFRMADSTWDEIGIPVRMAFFFTNSAINETVAFYPSPAGATESLLPLEAWREVVAANPELADIRDDVEALLINRTKDGFECYAVPIDACYHLVGIVKMHWKGFDGGEEAWQAINKFFAELRERSEVIEAGEAAHG